MNSLKQSVSLAFFLIIFLLCSIHAACQGNGRSTEIDALKKSYEIQVDNNNISEAINTCQKIIAILETQEDSLQLADHYVNFGRLHYEITDYPIAIEYYLKAKAIYDGLNYSGPEIGDLYHYIGSVHKRQDDTLTAIRYYQKELDFAIETEDKALKADALSLLSEFAETKEKALEMVLEVLEISRELKNEKRELITLLNVAIGYHSLNQFDQAIGHNKEAIKLSNQINRPMRKAQAMIGLGEVFTSMSLYDSASIYLDSALDLTLTIEKKQNVNLQDIYSAMIEVHKKRNDYKTAFKYLQLYNQTKSVAINESSKQKIAQLELSHKSKNQQQEIELLKSENEIQELIASNQSFKLWGAYGALGISLFIGIVVFILYSQKLRALKRLKVEQEKTLNINQALQKALDEKAILFKEVHHRVKNNLQIISSLLNLQSSTLNDPIALDAFEKSKGRINSMALIHNKLFETDNVSDIDFGEYVDQLTTEISSSYSDAKTKTVECKIEANGLRLDIDTSINLGLIITELITNSYKHAFDKGHGVICISLEKIEDNLKLSVCDNGKGLPQDFNTNDSSSLGMEIIKSLTEQLDGTLTIYSNKGAHFEIIFQQKNTNNPSLLKEKKEHQYVEDALKELPVVRSLYHRI